MSLSRINYSIQKSNEMSSNEMDSSQKPKHSNHKSSNSFKAFFSERDSMGKLLYTQEQQQEQNKLSMDFQLKQQPYFMKKQSLQSSRRKQSYLPILPQTSRSNLKDFSTDNISLNLDQQSYINNTKINYSRYTINDNVLDEPYMKFNSQKSLKSDKQFIINPMELKKITYKVPPSFVYTPNYLQSQKSVPFQSFSKAEKKSIFEIPQPLLEKNQSCNHLQNQNEIKNIKQNKEQKPHLSQEKIYNKMMHEIQQKSLFESNKNKGKLLHPNKFIIGFYSKENIDQYPQRMESLLQQGKVAKSKIFNLMKT